MENRLKEFSNITEDFDTLNSRYMNNLSKKNTLKNKLLLSKEQIYTYENTIIEMKNNISNEKHKNQKYTKDINEINIK